MIEIERIDRGRQGEFRLVELIAREDGEEVLRHMVSLPLGSDQPLAPVLAREEAGMLARAGVVAARNREVDELFSG